MLDFLKIFGQGLLNIIEDIEEFFTDNILISWLPADIQAVVLAVSIILIIIAIKRVVV